METKQMETIKKTISLEKVDWYRNSKELCDVTIDIRYENNQLSIQGNVWNPDHTDCLTCGQCYDTLLEILPDNQKLQEIVEIWKLWHLNDMRPTCEHQRELGWSDQASHIIYKWKLSLDIEIWQKRKEIEASIMQQIKETCQASVSEEYAALLALPLSVVIYTQDETLPPSLIPEHYKITPSYVDDNPNPTVTTRGWIRYSECPEGILCKPCPICGYKYGTKRNTEAIPDGVLEQIRSW